MSTGLIVFILILLAIFFMIIFLNKEGESEVSFIKAVSKTKTDETPQQKDNTNPYVSVEHTDQCDKLFFNSAVICRRIHQEYDTELITLSSSNHKQEKSFVKETELISILTFSWLTHFVSPSTGSRTFSHTKSEMVLSPTEGYIHYHQEGYIHCHDLSDLATGKTFLVASFYHDYNELLDKEYPFVYKVETDPFDNSKKIVWEKVNGSEYDHNLSLSRPTGLAVYMFRISFNLHDNQPVLFVFHHYKTTKGTEIAFLFDENTILRFPFYGKKSSDNSIIISLVPSDIDCFLTKKLLTIRVRKDDIIRDYPINEEEQETLVRYASSFKEALNTLTEEKAIKEWMEQCEKDVKIEFNTVKKADNSCWVYLMHDLANNAYKIGISNNPEYRERTLQSEKPTIEKIAAKQFPTRDIARAFEASLHKVYEMRRLRGEWFKLEPNEVEDVVKSLN